MAYSLLWVGGALLVYSIQLFVYAFFFSPVRRIPGPWYTRISRIPFIIATLKMRRAAWVASLMDHYQSSAIVIAPDQIHTTSEAAMKVIYDKSALKTSWYTAMGTWKGVTAVTGIMDYPTAATVRVNIIRCFQNQNLLTLVESIQSHNVQLKDAIHDHTARGCNIDGVVWLRVLALDTVTDVLWGEKRRTLTELINNPSETPDLIRRFRAFTQWNGLQAYVPGADTFVRIFGPPKWRQIRDDCNSLDREGREALRRWEQDDTKKHPRDVLSMLQAMALEEDPKKRMPNSHMPAHLLEMLIAGSSTTAHTAAFVLFLLARHPQIQHELRSELSHTYPDPTDLDPTRTLSLPYLSATIKETMRLYPMVPGPLPRHIGHPLQIMDSLLPTGTVASCAAWTQGRQSTIYPNPNTFDPSRWLTATPAMETNWIPFGTGSRMCPGVNLAMSELKYLLGTLLRTFRSIVPPGHEGDKLELNDVFAAITKSGHVWLRFEVAENEA